MKVVCCKNCGAKYQLDDNDDITSFECSSCAGDLELLENYSNENSQGHGILSSIKYDNSQIVQCEDCGLKYKIKANDNILDYECDSCGGSLRYLDSEMNKELDEYIDERKKELAEIRKNQQETPDEEQSAENQHSIKSITNKLETFFSEDEMQKIAEEELEEEKLQVEYAPRTARTTIPKPVLSKFEKEFAVPKSNDYNILKNLILKNPEYKFPLLYNNISFYEPNIAM